MHSYSFLYIFLAAQVGLAWLLCVLSVAAAAATAAANMQLE